MYDIPAVVFAGGRSSRMGEDKALLPFGGASSLSVFQYQKLSRLFKEVYLSSKHDKFGFDAPILYDRYEESSPLVGLVSCFETLGCEELFVLGVDMPFVDEAVIKRLYHHRIAGVDAIIPQTDRGLQPLCGFYRSTILSYAVENLHTGIHRLHHLLRSVNTLPITIENESAFRNLNTPQEYQNAIECG